MTNKGARLLLFLLKERTRKKETKQKKNLFPQLAGGTVLSRDQGTKFLAGSSTPASVCFPPAHYRKSYLAGGGRKHREPETRLCSSQFVL